MRKRKKSKTSERTSHAQPNNAVLSSSEFVAKRKEDALALAQLAYDMFVEQETASEEMEQESPSYISRGLS